MGFRNFPQVTVDLTEDDSDKVIAVPAGESWELLGIYVDLTTTVAVGDRQLEIQIRDPAGAAFLRIEFAEVQAASVSNKLYAAARGLAAEVHIAAEMLLEQLPHLYLPSGFDIRVFDSAAVAAAADDMLVRVNHISHSNL